MAEQSSIGVNFQYSTDGGSTWASVGGILDIDWPGAEKDVKEGTFLNQSDRWKTFFGAFCDAGEVTLKLKWNKTNFNTFLSRLDAQEPDLFRIVVPDGTDITDPNTCSRLQCAGLFKMLGKTFPSDGDKVTTPLQVKLSGRPTFTAAP